MILVRFQHASKATITMTANATVSESSVQASRIVVQASRVIDPNACKEPLRKKHEMVCVCLSFLSAFLPIASQHLRLISHGGAAARHSPRHVLYVARKFDS